MANQLSGGVFRSDLQLADGRQISYYDSKEVARKAKDLRDDKAQPGIGHLRLDPLVNEWIAVASHRQHRVFLPPKELCPLCPTVDSKLLRFQIKIMRLLYLLIAHLR